MPKLFKVKFSGVIYLLADSVEEAEDNAIDCVAAEIDDSADCIDECYVKEVGRFGHTIHGQWAESIPRVAGLCCPSDAEEEMTVSQWVEAIEKRSNA